MRGACGCNICNSIGALDLLCSTWSQTQSRMTCFTLQICIVNLYRLVEYDLVQAADVVLSTVAKPPELSWSL